LAEPSQRGRFNFKFLRARRDLQDPRLHFYVVIRIFRLYRKIRFFFGFEDSDNAPVAKFKARLALRRERGLLLVHFWGVAWLLRVNKQKGGLGLVVVTVTAHSYSFYVAPHLN
jgi:hypothetical protein